MNGLKANQTKSLERLFKRRIGGSQALTQEFATQLTLLAHDTNRIIATLVDRAGKVQYVMIGDADRVYLPDIGRARAGSTRLRGLRLIRTFNGRVAELTSEDTTDLQKLQLDAVISIGVGPGGYPSDTTWAYIAPDQQGTTYLQETFRNPSEFDLDFDHFIRELEAEFQRKVQDTVVTGADVALLVYVSTPQDRGLDTELAEMQELCRTAGVTIADVIVQKRSKIHPKYAVGRGKIEETNLRALELGADLVVFGQDLTPGQMRAITDDTELRVIDRTQLILDIFAQHATTRDGKLQVELAQLKYNLPRLGMKNTGMSRLTGGIGGRGPGETKLEINRRRANDRIRNLQKQIKKLSSQRKLRRGKRQRNQVPTVGIVGYTNAGKSTLLNQLTSSEVLSEDKLFATLNPTSRRLRFPDEREIIFTDTVGFIHDLPADLVAAFKATLEELEEADVLLHVIDISDPDFERRIEAVQRILGDLELEEKPQVLVFNKMDLIELHEATALARQFDAIPISALEKESTRPLVDEMERSLFQQSRRASQ